MSPDEPEAQKAFRDKFDFPFPLLSDAYVKLARAYEAWGEYTGVDRSTFLIDSQGVIRKIWRKVSVKGHVDTVLEAAGTIA